VGAGRKISTPRGDGSQRRRATASHLAKCFVRTARPYRECCSKFCAARADAAVAGRPGCVVCVRARCDGLSRSIYGCVLTVCRQATKPHVRADGTPPRDHPHPSRSGERFAEQ
jgi:hypothetical protein